MSNQSIITGQKIIPAKIRRARELRRKMTPAEGRLWHALRRDQLDGYHFRRQQLIDGFIADFYCHAARLIVEVDGVVHDKQADYDAARNRVMAERGLRLLRIKNEQVMDNLPGVLDLVRSACHSDER